MSDRHPIFDTVRRMLGRGFTDAEVTALDRAIDEATGAIVVTAPKPKHALAEPDKFYAALRKITGPLDQSQVDSTERILAAAAHHPIGWLAYVLGTAWHEARFKPQKEWGFGKGRPYGKPGKYGQAPYGRGLVQLTHDFNYEWADKRFGLEGALLKNFDMALDPELAAKVLVIGMEEGAFTGKKLGHYLRDGPGDLATFTKMRPIVNGNDKAGLIGRLAVKFQDALESGGWQ